MGTINAAAATMPHDHAAMTAGTTTAAGGMDHGSHVEPKAPKSGDPRFLNGSTGEHGENKRVAQKDGPAYGGQEVAKNQNNNDRKQNDYDETDANFMRTLGLIADPDTGQPMSYAQSIQAYNAAGALQELYPETYAKLVANQDAGRGTVLGGALAIFGMTKTDGFNGASLTGISDAEQGKIRNAQLGDLGSLRDQVINTRDFKGREWNRAHHPGSSWTAMKPLVEKSGFAYSEAALLTGDSMISWSGRVLGSNNQDGNETGFANDELAGLKYMVLMEQVTGKKAIESVLGGHAATHLPEDKLTNPKINKFIGLPEGFRPSTEAERNMVASRIRQWALQPGVKVDEGEFNKFVKAGMKTPGGQALAASGLLSQVQFKPKEAKTGGGGGNNNAAIDAATTPTALGTGEISVAPPVIGGGGDIAPIGLTGSNTLLTRPTIQNLGVGGPFPVLDPKTGKLDKALQDQLMTALLDVMASLNDNPFLDSEAETKAHNDGATKGAKFLKDEVAVDPTKVDALKSELASALKDGTISDEERTSLAEKLDEAGMSDVADAVKDGTATDEEIATLQEKVDGAASTKLEKDVTAALEDGKLTPEERKSIEKRLGKEGLDAIEKSIEDGTVTKEELESIADGTKKDVEAKKQADKSDSKGAATADAKDGADAAADGDKPDAANPKAGSDDAAAGATDVKSDKNADSKSKKKTDAKTDTKTDSKSDAKSEKKTDAKSDAKTDAKADTKTEAKAETKKAA